jgi:hypothetical protein
VKKKKKKKKECPGNPRGRGRTQQRSNKWFQTNTLHANRVQGQNHGAAGFGHQASIQKVLTDTDMKGSQDRLSIPRGQMRYDFLIREEQESLETKEVDGKHFKGMEVPLIKPGLKESSIFLKKWKLGSSCSYMLSNPWINIAKRNGLKSGNSVQLWSFRVNQRPHLALTKLQN